MRTHSTGAANSNPARVTIKPSLVRTLVRKAMGNYLMNSTSLEKTQSPVSGFCYAQNRLCDETSNYNCYKISIIKRMTSSRCKMSVLKMAVRWPCLNVYGLKCTTTRTCAKMQRETDRCQVDKSKGSYLLPRECQTSSIIRCFWRRFRECVVKHGICHHTCH